MSKKKFNPELLKEELNRFKLLNEYDFYQEKKELPEYKDLILGDLEEADENPGDLEPTDGAEAADAGADIANDLGVDAPSGEEETTGDIPEPDAEVTPEPTPEPAPEPVANDATEVDVTSLVTGSEEAKKAADLASHNSELLLQKINNLEAQLDNMSQISAKIDNMEQEMIKRNPTPVEKLEMRSLASYPYSQKLTDYWADKEGQYDVMNTEKKPEEYVLKQSDVDDDYSDAKIKNSFTVNDVDSDDYTEEDIY